MSSSVSNLNVGTDHTVPVEPLGGSSVVKVTGGATVYYADQLYVTASSNQGSIANGASQTFTSPVWLISASSSSVSVTTTSAAASSAPTGAAGGVLAGTYPNPGMAAGAAATNVGTVSGDLSGTLPSPTVAKLNTVAADAVTTKGDVLVSNATPALKRLGVGSDAQVLTADSTQATGVKWAAAAGGAPSGAAGGDLSGTYPNPGVAKLNGVAAASYALVVENVNTVATSGATQTIPDVTADTLNLITLSANCTFTFPTAAAGKSLLIALKQDGTGSRTATWPGTVKWPAGTAPTLTTTAAKTDVFSFVCADGTNWLGFTVGQNF